MKKIGTTDFADYTDPSARGAYRPCGPLKASLTESNRQEMQKDVECHKVYWNTYTKRVSKPSIAFLTFLFVIWALGFGISRQSRSFGSGLSGSRLFADKNNGKSCMKKNKKNSHREPGGHRVFLFFICEICEICG
jgi:hypothetical protein